MLELVVGWSVLETPADYGPKPKEETPMIILEDLADADEYAIGDTIICLAPLCVGSNHTGYIVSAKTGGWYIVQYDDRTVSEIAHTRYFSRLHA